MLLILIAFPNITRHGFMESVRPRGDDVAAPDGRGVLRPNDHSAVKRLQG